MLFLRSCVACLTLFGAETIVRASEGGAAGGSLMKPEIGTIFWTMVTFGLMVLLLGRFAWKPLIGAVDDRERSIRDSIDQATRDREQAELLVKQHKDLLVEARRERAEAVEQGKRDAERVKAEILDEAGKQREALLKQTETQVESALRRARDELQQQAVDLAILAAGKLLTRNLDDSTQRKLVEDHLADLERGSGDSLPS